MCRLWKRFQFMLLRRKRQIIDCLRKEKIEKKRYLTIDYNVARDYLNCNNIFLNYSILFKIYKYETTTNSSYVAKKLKSRDVCSNWCIFGSSLRNLENFADS